MGSAYTTIAADALARYARARGASPVTLVTGTDEHGEKIAASAAAGGSSPQAHVDRLAAAFAALWAALDIVPDAFIRTTAPHHEAVVAHVLETVWRKGDVYKAAYEGWYCVGCEAYKDDEELMGGDDRICPLHAKPCVARSEENYFFRLSRYQDDILKLLEAGGEGEEGEGGGASSSSSSFVQPAARRNEVLAWARGGLRDFSISRAAVEWGIPLPRDPAQTVYVWFDALLGYASALLPGGLPAKPPAVEGGGGGDDDDGGATAAAALTAAGWPPAVHLVGKDILRFHAVYWPGMLLSAGLPLPASVFAHGFLTKDGLKMGKALGNVLDPVALVGAYGPDAVRFFFMREVAFGSDGDFSARRFVDTVNAALANTLGNLAARCAALVHKGWGGSLPASASAIPADHPVRAAAEAGVAAASAAYDRLALHEAAAAAVSVAAAGNAAIDAAAPWAALKEGATAEDKAAAGEALVAALEAVRIAAVLLSPITPRLSARLLGETLGVSGGGESIDWDRDTAWGGLGPAGAALPLAPPAFARLELSAEDAASAGGGGKGGGGGGGKKQPKQPKKKKKEVEAAAAPAAGA
jgi:methionyl-tRNA synthetase